MIYKQIKLMFQIEYDNLSVINVMTKGLAKNNVLSAINQMER